MKNSTLQFLFLATIILTACSQRFREASENNDTIPPNLVILSAEQLNDTEISTCKLKIEPFFNQIECPGLVEANPNQQALVSAPLKGYLKILLADIGDYVYKGAALAILEQAEYIKLQQEFLEVKSQYDYYKEDFKRQGELTLENAASLKTMQQAQNEFRKTETRLFALRQQLSLIGIDADSLTLENMVSTIILRSPIQGQITKIYSQIGALCTEESPVFSIANTKNALLRLEIKQQFANRVTKGQPVDFSPVNMPDKPYKAKVRTVIQFNTDTTITVYADIQDYYDDIFPGIQVHARILTAPDSAFTLNNTGIFTLNGNYCIFRKINSTHFETIEIQVGREIGDRKEILNPKPDLFNSDIVISGVDYLLAELKKKKE